MTKPMVPPPVPARIEQIKRFLAANGYGDAQLNPLAGDASFRRYVRIHKGSIQAMLMDAPPEKEDVKPYLAVAEHLYKNGYSAPRVLAADAKLGFVLLEDFGDDSFTRVLKSADKQAFAGLERELYTAAVSLLAEWHGRKHEVADAAHLALPAYSQELLLQEAQLFSNWYLPQVLGKEKAVAMAKEYTHLWQKILASGMLATDQFVHRDYHADNLMWLPDRAGLKRVGLLDFQDGVYGDAAYDLVSLLEDARRDVPQKLADDMLEHYIKASGADKERFSAAYAILGAQRNSKIIGIFVRLAARDDKHHYLNFLPRVWAHLEHDLRHPALAELKQWLDTHVSKEWRGVVPLRHTSRELALSA